MIAHQLALIKREFWEHRSIWVTPGAIALLICVATLTGETLLSEYGEAVDVAIAGASNAGEVHRRAMLMGAMAAMTLFFAIGAVVVMMFYSLDTLYSERKDKSILFWRSLPITDAETVISKALTLFIVIPLFALAGAIVTHLATMVLSSVWIWAEGGNPIHLIWGSAPIWDVWFTGVITALTVTIWISPIFGWFLFVSAFTRRTPLLMAYLAPILVLIVEQMLPISLLGRALKDRFTEMPLAGVGVHIEFDDDDLLHLTEQDVSMLSMLDVSRFFSSPSVWLGLVVTGLFIAAAIYVRRYRDES